MHDHSCLMHLLIELKMVGRELKLAIFFAVASTSRASLLIPIGLPELQVQALHIAERSD